MRRSIKLTAALLALVFAAVLSVPAFAEAGWISVYFMYRHDPRLNPSAMADIIVDPGAVYGFSPSPDGSLSTYIDFDWTDPEFVNGSRGRQARIAYHESLKELYDIMFAMSADGYSIEEIARAVSKRRNELRIEAESGDPEGLAAMKARNLEKYGHEEGPLPDELYEQYGSWRTVLSKAFSVNSGMDACLGLYDDYYDVYVEVGQVGEDPAATREYAAAVFGDLFGIESFDISVSLTDTFTDGGDASPWLLPELCSAVGAGFLKGYEDGTLRPGYQINRVEAMAILSRFIQASGTDFETDGEYPEFSDLPEWAEEDIYYLADAGIILGLGDGTFGSYDVLTAEHLRLIAERIAEAAGLGG